MLVARSPPPPLGVSVTKHRAPVLQTCGLGRASSDTSKNFRFEVQTCSWKTVIGASCPPAPQSYRCHVILTEPRGSANQKSLSVFLADKCVFQVMSINKSMSSNKKLLSLVKLVKLFVSCNQKCYPSKNFHPKMLPFKNFSTPPRPPPAKHLHSPLATPLTVTRTHPRMHPRTHACTHAPTHARTQYVY